MPTAIATGRLTLNCISIVSEVLNDRDTRRATGVRAIDAVTKALIEYSSRVIFFCTSALNCIRLILRSAVETWPGGPDSNSGKLGHDLMDHHVRLGAAGTIPELEDLNQFGPRFNPSLISRYRNLMGDTRNYLRCFGCKDVASRANWARAVAELGTRVCNDEPARAFTSAHRPRFTYPTNKQTTRLRLMPSEARCCRAVMKYGEIYGVLTVRLFTILYSGAFIFAISSAMRF